MKVRAENYFWVSGRRGLLPAEDSAEQEGQRLEAGLGVGAESTVAPDTEHCGLGAEMEQEALRHRGLRLGSLGRETGSFYCLSRIQGPAKGN